VVLVHVIGYVVPTYHVAAVLGDVTVIDAETIVKGTLLTSFAVGFPNSLTLTIHCAEGVLGTIQLYDPVFGVDPIIVDQVVPLFVEYSIITLGFVKY
jgi:hypothetical protein